MTVAREVPSIGLYFFTYKNIRDQITKLQVSDWSVTSLADINDLVACFVRCICCLLKPAASTYYR